MNLQNVDEIAQKVSSELLNIKSRDNAIVTDQVELREPSISTADSSRSFSNLLNDIKNTNIEVSMETARPPDVIVKSGHSSISPGDHKRCHERTKPVDCSPVEETTRPSDVIIKTEPSEDLTENLKHCVQDTELKVSNHLDELEAQFDVSNTINTTSVQNICASDVHMDVNADVALGTAEQFTDENVDANKVQAAMDSEQSDELCQVHSESWSPEDMPTTHEFTGSVSKTSVIISTEISEPLDDVLNNFKDLGPLDLQEEDEVSGSGNNIPVQTFPLPVVYDKDVETEQIATIINLELREEAEDSAPVKMLTSDHADEIQKAADKNSSHENGIVSSPAGHEIITSAMNEMSTRALEDCLQNCEQTLNYRSISFDITNIESPLNQDVLEWDDCCSDSEESRKTDGASLPPKWNQEWLGEEDTNVQLCKEQTSSGIVSPLADQNRLLDNDAKVSCSVKLSIEKFDYGLLISTIYILNMLFIQVVYQ